MPYVNFPDTIKHKQIKPVLQFLRKQIIAYQLVTEEGCFPGGMKKRVLKQINLPMGQL